MDQKKQFYLNKETSFALIMTNSVYNGESVGEGYFADIKHTDNDFQLMENLADKFKIPKRNQIKLINRRLKLMRKIEKLSMTNQNVTIFMYYSGHGIQKGKSTCAVVKDSKMQQVFKIYDIQALAFSLASLPNVFVFTLFDCCRQKQQLLKSDNAMVGNQISGHLYQIFSTIENDVTPFGKNEKYSKVTLSFYEQCKKKLNEQKAELSISDIFKDWELKVKCPIIDMARVDLLIPYYDCFNSKIRTQNNKQDFDEDTKLIYYKIEECNNDIVEYLCPNGHKLKLQTDLDQRIKRCRPGQNAQTECCGVIIGSTKTPYYGCESCQFLICTKCISNVDIFNQLISLRLCPSGHFMPLYFNREIPDSYIDMYDNPTVYCKFCEKRQIEKDNFYLNCELCNHDTCENCFKISKDKRSKIQNSLSKIKEKQSSFKNHHLYYITYKQQNDLQLYSNCDLCCFKITQNKQDGYHCRTCNFDKCKKCYQNSVSQILPQALCPMKHKLLFYEAKHWKTQNKFCNNCRKDIWRNQLGTYNCSTCDFNRCSNCFINYK